jgi:hypothetical protein
LFETANLKLSSVASDLLGVSGRRIIEAMIAGEDSAELLSWKVRGKLRKQEKLVKESLKGCFNAFHRMMLKVHYERYEFLSGQVSFLTSSWFYDAAVLDTRTGLFAKVPLQFDGDLWRPTWAGDGRIIAVGADLQAAVWRFEGNGTWPPRVQARPRNKSLAQ